MIRAEYNDKQLVVDILSKCFDDNKSVNYIIPQDRKRVQRLRTLMKYSFDYCHLFGDIFISEDKAACALIVFPDKKKTTWISVLLDIKLINSCIGFSNITKTLRREAKIKSLHPQGLIYYLWFLGVDPNEQHKGIGTRLLTELIKDSADKQRPVYLETSTLKNIPWYEKFGFNIYNELDLGYKLFFLKRG